MKPYGSFFLGVLAGALLAIFAMAYVVKGVEADVAAAEAHARALERQQAQTADALERVKNSESVCVRELAVAAITSANLSPTLPSPGTVGGPALQNQPCDTNALAQIGIQYATGDRLAAIRHAAACAQQAGR